MRTIDRTQLRQRMNECGAAREPFLWAISYDMSKGLLIPHPKERQDVLWQVGEVGNISAQATPRDVVPTLHILEPPSEKEYAGMFAVIREGLMRGDSFLANLTCATRVNLTRTLKDVFLHSSAPYRLLIGDEFVCFSPEPFVTIEGQRISTYPMKGTIDASLPDAERKLMDDYKETCEHYTIVDLMRNDLGSVAAEVRVDDFRYVEHIRTSGGEILQTSSKISGLLPEKMLHRYGDILLPMLPAGSITGAPKAATVALIERAEKTPRGWYTGVFGYFDGRVMRTAVMIRCLQRGSDGALRFHSGGGVTVNSDAADEYAEMIAKIYLTR